MIVEVSSTVRKLRPEHIRILVLSLAMKIDMDKDHDSIVRLPSVQGDGQHVGQDGGQDGDVHMLYPPLRDGVSAEDIDAMLTAVETAVERVSSVSTESIAVGQILTAENATTLLPFVAGIRRMFNVAHQWLVDTPTLLTAVLATCLTNDVGSVDGSGSAVHRDPRDGGAVTIGSTRRSPSKMSLDQVTDRVSSLLS